MVEVFSRSDCNCPSVSLPQPRYQDYCMYHTHHHFHPAHTSNLYYCFRILSLPLIPLIFLLVYTMFKWYILYFTGIRYMLYSSGIYNIPLVYTLLHWLCCIPLVYHIFHFLYMQNSTDIFNWYTLFPQYILYSTGINYISLVYTYQRSYGGDTLLYFTGVFSIASTGI